METNALVGIDRAIVCLYRSLGLRRYLNETSQTKSPYFNMTKDNITYADQSLQLFCDYDGSYSMFSNKGTRCSSLYLTSLAFGALISPAMPFHDKVTLDRTLNWILSCQQEDGSFDDNRPCYDLQLFSDEFRRESLTPRSNSLSRKQPFYVVFHRFCRHSITGRISPYRKRPQTV
jgi:hypothetical protein